MKSGLHMDCPLKQWAAQWTAASHCLWKLIILSSQGLYLGVSVGRSCPITFNLIVIPHGQLKLLYDIVGSSNFNAEKVVELATPT